MYYDDKFQFSTFVKFYNELMVDIECGRFWEERLCCGFQVNGNDKLMELYPLSQNYV